MDLMQTGTTSPGGASYGTNARAFPLRALLTGAAITAIATAALGYNCWLKFGALMHAAGQQARIEEMLATVAHLDEMTTMSVRLAAATGEQNWFTQYQMQQQQRFNTITELLDVLPDDMAPILSASYSATGRLRSIEQNVFAMAGTGDLKSATAEVFSPEYETRRQEYLRAAGSSVMRWRDGMGERLDATRRQAYTIAAIAASSGVAILAVWIGVFRLVNEHRAARRQAEGALKAAHDELEERVAQRTKNLEEANRRLEREIAQRQAAQADADRAHRQLVETSRRVGMAEVATGVLHNVGNVLNSVNVSANVMRDRMAQSAAKDLVMATQLIAEHKDDLPDFIAHDAQGRHLPNFLVEVGGTIEQEQEIIRQELTRLAQSVEHIRAIINTQQDGARISDVIETLPLSSVVDEAIAIHTASLDRHQVRVERKFDSVHPMLIDRHRLLQILVNLISNAKHATDDAGHPDKQITIILREDASKDRAIIEVKDNGVGIPPENLTRVFAHGFTTRRDGHGFGLHACALSAREMGGSLIAHSDGPATGATFTLELPMHHHAEVAA